MEEVKKPSLNDEIRTPGSSSRVVKIALLVVGAMIALGILSYAVLSLNSGFSGLEIFKESPGGSTQEATTEPPSTGPESTSVSAPSPTPRPKGPGTYACSPAGVCNEYADPKKEEYGCPVTFADRLCLDSCNDVAKRCTK